MGEPPWACLSLTLDAVLMQFVMHVTAIRIHISQAPPTYRPTAFSLEFEALE